MSLRAGKKNLWGCDFGDSINFRCIELNHLFTDGQNPVSKEQLRPPATDEEMQITLSVSLKLALLWIRRVVIVAT